MRELDEVLRLRRPGVRFDYYMMDAFWFAKDGGYRTWRKTSWPNGPDAWIDKCKANGVRPGLWFSTNTLVGIDPVPQWENSLNAKRGAMSFSEGGFLPNFMETMQYWYDRGIRMFKFDFVDFSAATTRPKRRCRGTRSALAIRRHSATPCASRRVSWQSHALWTEVQRGPPSQSRTEYTLQTKLILRESTAIAPLLARSTAGT